MVPVQEEEAGGVYEQVWAYDNSTQNKAAKSKKLKDKKLVFIESEIFGYLFK